MSNRKPDIEPGSWSVIEFMARHDLSRSTWRKLVATGRAPKIIHLSGKLRRISYIEEARWLRERETPTEEIQREVDAHTVQAREAVAKAHQANRKKAAEG